MKEIFNHTHYDGYNWKNDIQQYVYSKTYTDWGNLKPYDPRITSKKVKENDNFFNPILQTYSDRNYDKQIRQKEKSALTSEIVKNLDNQLKIEQTFNIINLQDRLKGFEKDPNYPVMKDLIHTRKRIENYPKNFNIISNLPLTQHHYDKPENRPVYSNSESKKGKKIYKFRGERDFDIISTRYKHFNDEKNEVDKEVKKIRTAQLFYQKNDYNIIKGEYYNKEKEEDFQKKRMEEQKNWGIERLNNLPKCVKGKSDIYNLITLKTVDQKEMDRMIQEEKNKRKRYDIKYKLEKYYFDENMKKLDKQEKRKNTKASYLRYKEQDNRQYDIIDLKEKPYNEHKDIIKIGGVSEWQKIINGAGDNNTFGTKKIYKDPYDYSEADPSYDIYRKNRCKTLTKLPKIENDNLFNQMKKVSKCDSHNKNLIISDFENNNKKFRISKEQFFNKKSKNVNDKEDNNKIKENSHCFTTYAEGSRLSKIFDDTKEKNMRNKKRNLFLETGKK